MKKNSWIYKLYMRNPGLLGEILAIIIFWVFPIIAFMLILGIK